MRTNFRIILLITLFLNYFGAVGQVGIGTIAPNDSAMLDVFSSNKGVLFPRVSLLNTTDTSTILNGNVVGLIVFNNVSNSNISIGFYYWNGTEWIKLIDTPTRLYKGSFDPTNTLPVNNTAGDVYVNSATGKIYAYNGSNWISQSNSSNLLTTNIIATDGQTQFITPWDVSASNTKVFRNGVNIAFSIVSNNLIQIENAAICYSNDEIRIYKYL